MNMSEHRQMLSRGARGELRHDEPMSRHVSWRAGGRVRTAYVPADLDDLALFLRGLAKTEFVVLVGLGSNLLVRDGGLDGTVILTHRALGAVRVVAGDAKGGALWAQAGVSCPKLARTAAFNNLAGAEFMAGIPGTLGGALAMNAGCYGRETWDLVAHVETIDRTGTLHGRTPDEYSVGYRHVQRRCGQAASASTLIDPQHAAEEWFVSATLRLAAGDGAVSRAKIKALLSQRIATQPLGEPNAGSVFRNPPGDHAARLIEACGLKGRVIGGAAISAMHANFIVNRGGASAADIESLMDLAQDTVRRRFGVVLEREVRVIGVRQ